MKTQEHTAGATRAAESIADRVDGYAEMEGSTRKVDRQLLAELIDRETRLPQLLEALKLVDLHFQRNLASDNFQGDDEHEAWNAVRNAIKSAKGETL